MNLREAFEEIPQCRSGRPCLACVQLSEMSDEDASTLRELLAGSSSSRVIFEAVQRAGYETLTLSALKRHRRGECIGLT